MVDWDLAGEFCARDVPHGGIADAWNAADREVPQISMIGAEPLTLDTDCLTWASLCG